MGIVSRILVRMETGTNAYLEEASPLQNLASLEL